LDLIDKGITGKLAEARLGEAHITVNKNSVPNDPKSPFVTSGLRLGSPAGTTRGFGKNEFSQIANWIADIIDDIDNDEVIEKVKAQVIELCHQFPVYQD
jgi:glycine hydroxymethyltransferase